MLNLLVDTVINKIVYISGEDKLDKKELISKELLKIFDYGREYALDEVLNELPDKYKETVIRYPEGGISMNDFQQLHTFTNQIGYSGGFDTCLEGTRVLLEQLKPDYE